MVVSLQRFAQKLQRSMTIPALCDIGFQYFTLVIDGAPEIMNDAIYLHENLVQTRIRSTRFRLLSAANIGPNRFHQNRTVS